MTRTSTAGLIVATALSLGFAGPAEADGIEAGAVVWQGPSQCDAGDALEAQLDEALHAHGRTDARTMGPTRVVVVAQGAVLHASIELPDGTRRTLASPHCTTLTRAVAQLVIATARVGRDAPAVAPSEPTPSEPTPPPAVPSPPPPDPTPPLAPAVTSRGSTARLPDVSVALQATAPRSTGRVADRVRLHAGVGARLGGIAQLRVAADAEWATGLWAVSLGATHGVQRTVVAPNAEGDLRSTGGRARTCVRPVASRVSFPICVGAEIRSAWARGRGEGVTSRPSRRLWGVGFASGGVGIRIVDGFTLVGRAGVDVSVNRPAFHIRRGELELPLAQLPRVAGTVAIDLVVAPWKRSVAR